MESDFITTEEFYDEESDGMFATALKNHLEKMDSNLKSFAVGSSVLETQVASGDFFSAVDSAFALFFLAGELSNSLNCLEEVFSQDMNASIDRTEAKLRQYSLKVFSATEDECEGEATER